MRLTKLFILITFLSITVVSCKKDDDGSDVIEPVLRDKAEQAIADDEAIIAYLQTHFYNQEDFENPSEGFDKVIKFDTISGENANKTPLIESDLLTSKVITRDEVDYKIYILKVREGAGDKPTFADSTYQNYRGELLNGVKFDQANTPLWFDLQGYISTAISNGQAVLQKKGGVIPGFAAGVTEFREASGFTLNDDNTVKWNDDYGIGAIFFPSGLGYFASASGAIPAYSPLIFSFQLFGVNEADHDGDGIPSYMEDLDGDKNVFNDDTDGNNYPNNSDVDDDGDGTLTKNEITVNEDGTITFPDNNGNGIPNYLDPEEFEDVNNI